MRSVSPLIKLRDVHFWAGCRFFVVVVVVVPATPVCSFLSFGKKSHSLALSKEFNSLITVFTEGYG